jgi:apolipoprotein N-acyltransferase
LTKGWVRALAALAAGTAAVLGQAPFGLWPVTIAAFGVLFVLMRQALGAKGPARAAALTAFFFGFGFFGFGLHWIGEAFLVRGGVFVTLMPFAIAGLALFLALFFAAASLLWVWSGAARQGVWASALTFTAALSLTEYLRGVILTGFPWNLPGAVLTETWAGQGGALIGVHGLTVFVILAGAAAGALAIGRGRGEQAVAVATAICLAGLFAHGAARLRSEAAMSGTIVRLVQPDIRQAEKWKPELRARHWQTLLTLTAEAPIGPAPSLVIWPEAAPPLILDWNPEAVPAAASALASGQTLLAGWARAREEGGRERFTNALVAIGADGSILDSYDKAHLVPFGEYVPFPALFDAVGLGPIASRLGSFTPGPGLRTIRIEGLPAFGPLICYEAIFPGAAVAPGDRPEMLVAITDDTWFGTFTGPWQHLAAARMRAIEEGLPVLRAAMSGVSAVIDPRGRITASLPLLAKGVLDAPLPAADAPTFFSTAGHWPFAILLAFLAVLGILPQHLSRSGD